jgi:hypothetical protein
MTPPARLAEAFLALAAFSLACGPAWSQPAPKLDPGRPARPTVLMAQTPITVPVLGKLHATAAYMFEIDAARTQLCWHGAASPPDAHLWVFLHKGGANVAGPRLLETLPSPPTASGLPRPCVKAASDLLTDIIANPGGYYIGLSVGRSGQVVARAQLKLMH